MTEDCLYVFFSKEDETSWIWRWCIDYGKKVIRNLFFRATWNDRWKKTFPFFTAPSFNTTVWQRLFFSGEFKLPLQQLVQEGVFYPVTKHISVEILRVGIKQIATLCYHQYKLNGANLKDEAMNAILLNIQLAQKYSKISDFRKW